MSTFDRLKEKILNDLSIHTKDFRRTNPGHWQLKSGAWKWACKVIGQSGEIGSKYTATDLLKSNKLIIDESGEIFPN